MASFELRAGNTIDVLTHRELEAEMAKVRRMFAKAQAPPLVIDTAANVTSSAAGVVSETEVYVVPVGTRQAVIHRIHVTTVAATPATPVAAGFLTFNRDVASAGNFFDGLPQPGNAVVAPAVLHYGSDAKVLRNGQRLVVAGGGLPANTEFLISVQLRLFERVGEVE